MSEGVEETPVSELIDPERFGAWLAQESGDSSPAVVERLMAGHSNLTFTVKRGGTEWILRRPPRGPLLPTAHDVVREFKVISLLKAADAAGSRVRVPAVDFACEDTEVIGVPFYLMERVPGAVIREEWPDWLSTPQSKHAFTMDVVTALAELHAVDVTPFVDARIGKPSGYLERQLRRWIGQREGVRDALASIGMTARELPDYDIVRDWLVANCPVDSGAASIVHGDYKIDNVICVPGEPKVAAIVDWEMATVGDPLADLGYFLSFWLAPEDGDDDVAASIGRDIYTSEGMPTQQEIIDHYGALSGRSMRDVSFYVTLAIWKLAILLEGNYSRHLTGTADDPFYATLDTFVPSLLRRARMACGA